MISQTRSYELRALISHLKIITRSEQRDFHPASEHMFMNSSALAVVNFLLTFVAPQLLDELAFMSRYLLHWQTGPSASICIMVSLYVY